MLTFSTCLYVSASLSAYYKATRACVANSSALILYYKFIVCTDLGTASKDYLQDCYCAADLLKSKAELFSSANCKISEVDSFLYNL